MVKNTASEGRPIFISYRRTERTLQIVKTLAGLLEGYLWPRAVFWDGDLHPGDSYPHELESALEDAKVVLAVIDPDWLFHADRFGRRRIDDHRDWVHREVAHALEREKLCIPVVVDGASMPPRDALPPGVRDLAVRQAVSLPADMSYVPQGLIDVVERDLVASDDLAKIRRVTPALVGAKRRLVILSTGGAFEKGYDESTGTLVGSDWSSPAT